VVHTEHKEALQNGEEQSKLQAASALQMFISALTPVHDLPENMQRLE